MRKNEFVDKYNAVIKRIALEEGVDLIDVNRAYLDHNYQSLLGLDGLHPNANGHALIYELVRYYVPPQKHHPFRVVFSFGAWENV